MSIEILGAIAAGVIALVALLIRKRTSVVEVRSEELRNEFGENKQELEEVYQDLEERLEEANEEASNEPAPGVDAINAELERLRAKRDKR